VHRLAVTGNLKKTTIKQYKMKTQKIKALEIFKLCKKGVDILTNEYKPITNEGRFEAIIFNSLTALDKVQTNYRSEYELISNYFFVLLLEEAQNISIALDKDTLIDLINSRFQYFDNELQRLYSSKTAFPGGTYHVFFEKPLNLNPEISGNLMEILRFYKALTSMMNYISDNSENL